MEPLHVLLLLGQVLWVACAPQSSSAAARRTLFSEPTKSVPGPEKSFTGIRVSRTSNQMIYYHEQTIAVVELGPGRELVNCELLEVKTEKDRTAALSSLSIVKKKVKISLPHMLDLQSQCQKMPEPQNTRPNNIPGDTERAQTTQAPFSSIFVGIFPGTKWCGRGDLAETYFDLGEESTADKCCRTHDLCPVKVSAMKTQYNITNYSMVTRGGTPRASTASPHDKEDKKASLAGDSRRGDTTSPGPAPVQAMPEVTEQRKHSSRGSKKLIEEEKTPSVKADEGRKSGSPKGSNRAQSLKESGSEGGFRGKRAAPEYESPEKRRSSEIRSRRPSHVNPSSEPFVVPLGTIHEEPTSHHGSGHRPVPAMGQHNSLSDQHDSVPGLRNHDSEPGLTNHDSSRRPAHHGSSAHGSFMLEPSRPGVAPNQSLGRKSRASSAHENHSLVPEHESVLTNHETSSGRPSHHAPNKSLGRESRASSAHEHHSLVSEHEEQSSSLESEPQRSSYPREPSRGSVGLEQLHGSVVSEHRDSLVPEHPRSLTPEQRGSVRAEQHYGSQDHRSVSLGHTSAGHEQRPSVELEHRSPSLRHISVGHERQSELEHRSPSGRPRVSSMEHGSVRHELPSSIEHEPLSSLRTDQLSALVHRLPSSAGYTIPSTLWQEKLSSVELERLQSLEHEPAGSLKHQHQSSLGPERVSSFKYQHPSSPVPEHPSSLKAARLSSRGHELHSSLKTLDHDPGLPQAHIMTPTPQRYSGGRQSANDGIIEHQEHGNQVKIEDHDPSAHLSSRFSSRQTDQFKEAEAKLREEERLRAEQLEKEKVFAKDPEIVPASPEEEDRKAKKSIQDLFLYVMFLVTASIIVLSMTSRSAYYITDAMVASFMETPFFPPANGTDLPPPPNGTGAPGDTTLAGAVTTPPPKRMFNDELTTASARATTDPTPFTPLATSKIMHTGRLVPQTPTKAASKDVTKPRALKSESENALDQDEVAKRKKEEGDVFKSLNVFKDEGKPTDDDVKTIDNDEEASGDDEEDADSDEDSNNVGSSRERRQAQSSYFHGENPARDDLNEVRSSRVRRQMQSPYEKRARPFGGAAGGTGGSETTLRTANTIQDFWDFAETTLVNMLYWDFWYSYKAPMSHTEKDDELVLYSSKLLGVPRIRQLRVTFNSCSIHPQVSHLFNKCYGYYASDTEDREGMAPVTTVADTVSAWTFTSAEQLKAAEHYGTFSNYGGGGFYLDLSPYQTLTQAKIAELKENLWINRGTRAIIIDFAVYNSNVNLFVVTKIVIEIPPTGGITPTGDFYALKFLRYVSTQDFIVLGFELSFIFFAGYYTVTTTLQIMREGGGFFLNAWNILDIVIIVLCYTCIICGIYRYFYVEWLVVDLMVKEEEHPEFDFPRAFQTSFDQICAVLLFFLWIKFFKYLNFNQTINELNKTLARSTRGILSFTVMFSIIFFAFAQLAYLLFGTEVEDYRTVWTACMSLLQAVLGKFNYRELEETHFILGPMFLILFVFFIFFVLMNMFGAIIIESYKAVRSQIFPAKEKLVGTYLTAGVMNLLTCGKGGKGVKKQDSETTITYGKIRDALHRAGFTEVEIEIFFAKYDIRVDRDISGHEAKKLIAKLELRRFDFDPIDMSAQTVADLEKEFEKIKKSFDELERKVDSHHHHHTSIL